MQFSVVIPTYRAEAFLAQAIESALSQTFLSHEILVVDDCSPQNEAVIAARYPVNYIRRSVNGGEAAAKNHGASVASGDFVVTLDADDWWMPERLEAINELLAARPELDIVTTDALIEDGSPRPYYTDATWASGDQRTAILERNFIFSHAAVRRDRWLAVSGMPEGRGYAADWPFWVRLLMTGSTAGLVETPLAHYRVVEGSISDSPVVLARTFIEAMTEALRQDLTARERQAAGTQLAAGRRDLRRLLALEQHDVLELLRIALDARYRRRERAEALWAVPRPIRGPQRTR